MFICKRKKYSIKVCIGIWWKSIRLQWIFSAKLGPTRNQLVPIPLNATTLCSIEAATETPEKKSLKVAPSSPPSKSHLLDNHFEWWRCDDLLECTCCILSRSVIEILFHVIVVFVTQTDDEISGTKKVTTRITYIIASRFLMIMTNDVLIRGYKIQTEGGILTRIVSLQY